MVLGDLLEKTEKVMEGEPRLLQLPPEGKVVFVGDTHGDLDATEEIIRRYLRKPYRIAFLGDYVDRGQQSEENIQYLLQMKCEHPDQLFLLAGNHEGFMAREFYPADFWKGLSPEEREAYGLLFAKLPLAITSQNGILGVHGGLPEVSRLEEINQIEWGDSDWEKIVWGDFVEEEGNVLGSWGGRLQLGRSYFEGAMKRFERRLLVRSHQPHAPRFMFKKRCVTIFTSKVYLPTRTILIADMERDIRRADDVTLETI